MQGPGGHLSELTLVDLRYDLHVTQQELAPAQRDVSRVLRIKVCDAPRNGIAMPFKEVELTIWNPNEQVASALKEGDRYLVRHSLHHRRRVHFKTRHNRFHVSMRLPERRITATNRESRSS